MRKDGRQSDRQRYRCRECGHRFQYKKRDKHLNRELWSAYTHGKQTLAELGEAYGRTYKWVRMHLDKHAVIEGDLQPQTTIIVPDTTFWGRSYGVCVFRSWNLRRNLWWHEVSSEKVVHYHYGRKILEDRGWTFTAAVVDGRRGLAGVFKNIPVQTCHFHQMKTVTKYLTRRPKTEAGVELRSLTLTLTKTDEHTFTRALADWDARWHDFYIEKTQVTGTKHWYYTHKNVRSAFLSLVRNLPTLFTYQRHPDLHIPNTTNTIDGYRVISELLRGS